MRPKNIDWNWRYAAFGLCMAIVASLVTLSGNVTTGVGILIGSIPAAIIGLAPDKKSRRMVFIASMLFSVSILLGSILALAWPLAVVGMYLLARISALRAAEKPSGLALLSICLPLTAIGLTYTGVQDSLVIALLFAVGGIGSYLWAMILPEYEGKPQKPVMLEKDEAKPYSHTLAIAAGLSTLIGFLLGVEYVGWLVGSTMLVMRPAKEMLELRGVGRTISVFAGALIAAWLLTLDLSLMAAAVLSGSVLVMMAATSASRWYVTPAFTSFLILWAILFETAARSEIEFTFEERVWDTIIGVAIAYIVGISLPKWQAKQATKLA